MIISQITENDINQRFRSKSTKELSSILKKTSSFSSDSRNSKFARFRSNSTQSLDNNNNSKKKNVRFSRNLTVVKKFDKFAEPITISNSNSPDLSPLLIPLDNNNTTIDDSCWFRDLSLVPRLIDIENNFNELGYSRKKLFSLDDDEDDEIDENDNNFLNNYILSKENIKKFENNNKNDLSYTDSNISKWELINTNIINSNLILTNDFIKFFMHKQMIKIQSLKINNENKLIGYLIVNNLAFEKYIEIKFTFNNWLNIHYVNASYNKTISENFDQFKFVIDINSFKFFLNLKNLLAKDFLNMELCCRYDVRHETYYDNNNYNNYKITLKKPQLNNHVSIPRTEKPLVEIPKKIESKVNSSGRHHTRTFSADTDFFNTSPLKNIYYNNTQPANTTTKKQNVIVPLKKSISTSAMHTIANIPEKLVAFNSDLSSISSSSISSATSTTSTDSSSLYSFQNDNATSQLIKQNSLNLQPDLINLHQVTNTQLLSNNKITPPTSPTNLTFKRDNSPPVISPLDDSTIQETIMNTAVTPGIDYMKNYLSPSLADIKDQLYLSPSKNSSLSPQPNHTNKSLINDNNTITSYPDSIATDTTIIKNNTKPPSVTIARSKKLHKNTSTSSLESDYKSLLDSCCFYTPSIPSPTESPSNSFPYMSSLTD
ncbi:hypothetical protein C6P45_004328 [Maudiozyma exigua]|uniref:CBM21 domain-containing protein n=1 Tax=Maudiozyma exigua TaxID=34358 RepID=A0A9P6WBY9_MAUEX|nr:hypothetical protein C6P45_004328 [Kazachstania exigua]